MPETLYLKLLVHHRLVKKVSMLRRSGNTFKTLRILRTNSMKSNKNIKMLTTNYYMHLQVLVLLVSLVVFQLLEQYSLL